MRRSLGEVPNYQSTYESHFAQLAATHGPARAAELVVGGQYEEVGRLEFSVLRQLGLSPEHSLVDVGCGSGRLAAALQPYLTGRYWGIDILDTALDYARWRCPRDNFEFSRVTTPAIPVPENRADFVVFFSVFTHLLDEDIFKYLREARRVAKPTTKIVCSFLDLESEAHWPLFLATAADQNPERILNKFTTTTALSRLARAAGLNVVNLYAGTEKWIVTKPDADAEDSAPHVEFGQSIAVFDVFPEASYLAMHPDVRAAVAAGQFRSGAHHYDTCGHKEGRPVS